MLGSTALPMPDGPRRQWLVRSASHSLVHAATSITWSKIQRQRWGSCTIGRGDIRISDRLVDVPPWVLDSVIIHELTHLVVADHGPEFERLVQRYPLHERATGYLMAVSDRLNALPPSEVAD